MVKTALGGRGCLSRTNRKEASRKSPFCLVAIERLTRKSTPNIAGRGRQFVLAGSALAFGFVFSLSGAQKAIAATGCVDDGSAPNTVLCNAARITTDAFYDVTAGGTSANRSEREQLFTANGNVGVTVTAAGAITGFGLAVTTTQAGANITMGNAGAISVNALNAPTAGGTEAVNLNTTTGTITYTGAGSITNNGASGGGLQATSQGGAVSLTINDGATISGAGFAIGGAQDAPAGTGAVAIGIGNNVQVTSRDAGVGSTAAAVFAQNFDTTNGNGASVTVGSGVNALAGSVITANNLGNGVNPGATGIAADADGLAFVTISDGTSAATGHKVVVNDLGDAGNNTGILVSGAGTPGGGTDIARATTGAFSQITINTGGTAAGGSNIGIGMFTSSGIYPADGDIRVATGANSTITVGQAGSANPVNWGISANAVSNTPMSSNVIISTGANSSIRVFGDSGYGIDARLQNIAGSTGDISVTTGAGSTITLTDDTPGGFINAGINTQNFGTGKTTVVNGATILVNGADQALGFGILAQSFNGNVDVGTTGTVTAGQGIHASSTLGGIVTITANANVTGTTGEGIVGGTENGLLTINVGNGVNTPTVTGATDAAIAAFTTGVGNVQITTAVGSSILGTQRAIRVDQSAGVGSATIDNSAFVNGAGTATFPVIEFNTKGVFTLNNTVNGYISSTSQNPMDLVLKSTTLAGASVINNSNVLRGRIDLTDGVDTLTNFSGGSWRSGGASFFHGGADVIANNAGAFIYTVGPTTIDMGAGADVVTNAGSLFVGDAFGVAGTASFVGLENFNNAGGLVTMIANLPAFLTSNTFSVSGNFNATGNSRLGVDTFLGGPGSPSDRLLVGGNVTGVTNILVADANAGPGAINLAGINVVAVTGTTASNFVVSPANPGYRNYGPLGAIDKGFIIYPLIQTGGLYSFYGVPDAEALALPYAITGAQNIFFDTAADWTDRQDDLHRWWRSTTRSARSAAGGGADLPVKAPPRPGYIASGTGPGLWVKASGSWTDRSTTFDLGNVVAAAAGLGFDMGFKQNTYSVTGGYDAGGTGLINPADALVVGLMGGYIESTLKFNATSTNLKYTGGTVGASATYLNNGWFADALLKADFLKLSLNTPSLVAFGFAGASVDVTNVGFLGNFGYRYNWGKAYLEPSATLAYVRTSVDNFSATTLGFATNFSNGESFRGAIGARLGSVVMETDTHVVDVSIQGKYWDEFSSTTGVMLLTTGPGITLDDSLRTKGYGEVRGLVDVANKGTGFSGFVDGGAKFNNQFTTITAKGGVRYQW